jgi:hypothetical protein
MYAHSQHYYHMFQGGLCLSQGAMLYFQMLKRGPKNRRGDTLVICCQRVDQNVADITLTAVFWRQCFLCQKKQLQHVGT